MKTMNIKGDELRVRHGKNDTVRIEVVRFDGSRLYSIEMKPLDAAYLADDIHRAARELVKP